MAVGVGALRVRGLLLAVTTFVFYRAAEEASSKAAAAADSQRAAEDSYNAENFKVQYLMHILGAQTLAETEFSAVQASMLGIPEMKARLLRRLSPTEALLKDEPLDRRLQASLRTQGVHLQGP